MMEQLLILDTVIGVLLMFTLYRLRVMHDNVNRLSNHVGELTRREHVLQSQVDELQKTSIRSVSVGGSAIRQDSSLFGITNLPRLFREDNT